MGILYVFYVLAVIIAVFASQDTVSLTVNFVDLAIVALVFFASAKCFKKMNAMKKELSQLSQELAGEGEMSSDENPFANNELYCAYENYLSKERRLNANSEDYDCDISDYINRELLDKATSKNMLNLVPGAMTGLGILGTFVGLTIALINFNVGNAAEIADSIPKLMNGIKVAFVTSIFCMTFSLLFSFILKKNYEVFYATLDSFLDRFDSLNATYDNESRMHSLLKSLPSLIGDEIAKFMRPEFEKMNQSLSTLAENVNEHQIEGVSVLADEFVEKLNGNLGDSFKNLAVVIDNTCRLQEESGNQMRIVLDDISSMAVNLKHINEIAQTSIEKYSQFVIEVEKQQDITKKNLEIATDQLEKNQAIFEKADAIIENLTDCENKVIQISEQFSTSMLDRSEAILSVSSSVIDGMNSAAVELNKTTQIVDDQLTQSLHRTFKLFDEDLSDITKHLSGTLIEVKEATERVPEVVKYSFEGLEQTFGIMQNNLDDLVKSFEIMRKNIETYCLKLEKIESEQKRIA